jgi:hypothetical protein
MLHGVIRGSGDRLPDHVRLPMEARLGADLRDVRVHSDARAAASARAVGARAYAVGNHVAFGESEYQPETTAGRDVIAHELAHVALSDPSARQASLPSSLTVSEADAADERAATDPTTTGARDQHRDVAVRRIPMSRENILKRMAELEEVVNDMSRGEVERTSATAELNQLSVLLAKGAAPAGPSSVNMVAPSNPPTQQPTQAAPAAPLTLPLNASLNDMVTVMQAVDAIGPSTVASGLFTTTYRGRSIDLTPTQVSQLRKSTEQALGNAITRATKRRDSAVSRYQSQEDVNADFPVTSRAAKAWSWISTWGNYKNPRESVYAQSALVNRAAEDANNALRKGRYAEAVKRTADADAASERTEKFVYAYIDQLISGGESIVTGLTYTRDAAFITVGVLGVIITGGAALGLEAGVVGTGVGGLTVGQTVTVVSVGAPIVANVAEAGVKVAYGDKVDWGRLAVDTAVQIVLAKFGGKLSAGIAGEIAGNPATQTLARQAIASLVSGAATHVVSQAFSTTVSSVYDSLKGQDVTWEKFTDRLLKALSDPAGWFMVAVSAGVHTVAQQKVSTAVQKSAVNDEKIVPPQTKETADTAKVVTDSATVTPQGKPPVTTSPPPDETTPAATQTKPTKPAASTATLLRGYYGGEGDVRKGFKRTAMPEDVVVIKGPPGPPKPVTVLSIHEQAMVADAQVAKARLGRPLAVKTKAAEPLGDVSRSGSGKRGSGPALTNDVMVEAKRIGHLLEENTSLDNGIPGQEKASHAEKIAAVKNPGRALAVDRAMCADCFAFFQKLAIVNGANLVVQEPTGTWIFRPDGSRVNLSSNGTLVIHPNGTASAGPPSANP